MKEAADGATTWEHVDEQNFIRFGQYVYTGNYEGEPPLEPEPEHKGEAQKAEDPPAEDDDWAFTFAPKKTQKEENCIWCRPDRTVRHETRRSVVQI